MDRMKTQLALLTGASGGLGIEFAKALAQRQINLVLTARRSVEMEMLANDLRKKYEVDVIVEPIDLAVPGSASTLVERLDAQKIEPTILVNNAGFGICGEFADTDTNRLASMLAVDVVAFTELAHVLGKRMRERDGGYMLFVAGVAAFQPTPALAAYSAAKAYVLSLGEALHVELAPKVSVTVLSPGYMETGFSLTAGFHPPSLVRRTAMPPSRVAAVGVQAMLARKFSVVAGGTTWWLMLFARILPRKFLALITFRILRKSY
jgi:short-subunit dehydrogenase